MREDRVFTTTDKDKQDVVLVFKRPNQNIINKAELISRAKFSNALRAGILLNAEAQKLLVDRDLYGTKEEEQELKLRTEIQTLEAELKSSELPVEKGDEVCAKIIALRTELRVHNSVVTSIMENTCESIANEERNQFLAASCIYDNKTGAKVYKDVEDFKNRYDEKCTLDCYRETVIAYLETLAGKDLPSDLTSELPENKWLSKRKVSEEDAVEKPKKSKRGKKAAK